MKNTPNGLLSSIYDSGRFKRNGPKQKREPIPESKIGQTAIILNNKYYSCDKQTLELLLLLKTGEEYTHENREDYAKFSKVVYFLNKVRPFSFHIQGQRVPSANFKPYLPAKKDGANVVDLTTKGALKAFTVFRLI